MIQGPLLYVVGFACIAVLIVLLIGVGGFAKGGDFNRKYANKIMRMRLYMQFFAVVLIVGAVWWSRSNGG